jgi:hypothetical protein
MSNQLLLPLIVLPLSGIIFLIILFMILNKVLKSPEAVEIEMKAGKFWVAMDRTRK